ncbi:VanZ family protein [Oribacterium sp. NK2B42]|uniref:VanZ family protein n=1 Tax=Oribacterium sp. NK2B42 TaxID=689781 RepID=UPI0006781791|nr:VanZ family protein [Oribacterium sp. NK2B42]
MRNEFKNDHNKSRKRCFFPVLVLLWMLAIFLMSSQPADDSTETSLRVGEAIGKIFVPGYIGWSEEAQLEFAENIDHPVRKAAHATEYTILGILLFMTCRESFGMNLKASFKNAFLAGTAYAATDEFHQLFVPGRAGMVSDVLIDSLGVLFGCLLVSALCRILRKKRNVSTKGMCL